MMIDRRRFLQFSAAALPFVALGCGLGSAQRGSALAVNLDGARSARGASPEGVDIPNLADGSATAAMPESATLRPRTVQEGWQFSRSNMLTIRDIPPSAEFSLFAVFNVSDSRQGAICSVIDSDGLVISVVLVAEGVLAVWSSDEVELLRVEHDSIAPGRKVAFAFTFDASRIGLGFINGRHVGTFDGRVGFGQLNRAGLGAADLASAGDYPSYSGVLRRLRIWTEAVQGATLREEFDDAAAQWDTPVISLVTRRRSEPVSLPLGLKGSCVVPKAADITQGSAWRNLWVRWDWNWIRDSIDLARDAGSSSIRIIGDVAGVQLGDIDIATYSKRLDQFLAYCESRDCTVYYCLVDLRHAPRDRILDIRELIPAVAQVLARHRNVIAVELCNEVSVAYSWADEAEVRQTLGEWATRLRENVTVPISVSDILTATLTDELSNAEGFAAWRDIIDFFDIHVYDPPELANSTNFLAPYDLATDIPLLFGEVGASRFRVPDRRERYRVINVLANSSPSVHGAFQWGVINDEFGLYVEDEQRPQPDLINAWRSFEMSAR